MNDRERRILEMVLAPGFQCYPSKLNHGMVVMVDGRTGLDACEQTAERCFDALLDEIDGHGSPGRIFLSAAPTHTDRRSEP